MQDQIGEKARALHNSYLPLRHTPVPFPPQSVAFFSVLLAGQQAAGITGDMIEVGVQHGGTAFLTISALNPGERQVLIDLRRTPEFQAKYDLLPQDRKDQVTLIEGDSHAAKDQLSVASARFIHIDGGHLKHQVRQDLVDYIPFLAADGVLCADDVFEIKWPGVTEAVIEVLPQTDVVPFAMVDRKLYCCRAPAHSHYLDMVSTAGDSLGLFGSFRSWIEEFLGSRVFILKMVPNSSVARTEL